MQKSTVKVSKKAIVVLAASLSLVTLPAWSDNNDSRDAMYKRMQEQGYGMGRGNMGYGGMGYGGMGMMGGGMGYGGMGMMGGGMGYGSMGMMGGGMGYGGMYAGLHLDKKQRNEIRELYRDQRDARFKVMREMMDLRFELADLYDHKVLDAKAIGKIYGKIFDKQRQLIEENIQLQNRIRGLLNKEQQSEYDGMYHGQGMMGGGMGMMR